MSSRSGPRALLAAIAASALLAACGGGGDDDAGIPANTPFDTRAAMANLLRSGGAWTLAGRANDNFVYEVSLAFTPASGAAFPLTGQSLARTLQQSTIRQGGSTVGSDQTEVFYDASSGALVGTRDGDGACSAVTVTGTLPTDAFVGEEGPYYSTVDYANCSVGTAISQSATRWSVQQNGGRAYFCLTTTASDNSYREIDCLQIASNGALGSRARVRFEVAQAGGSTFVLDADN